VSKELQDSIASLTKQMEPIANLIAERLRPVIVAIANADDIFRQKIEPIIRQFAEAYGPIVVELVKQSKKWQEDQKLSVTNMAEQGWFPNWYTFFFTPEKEYEDLDSLMIAQIDDCWEELKVKIIEFVPNRQHILETAFLLHEQGNYIASIPLLLAQSDGICSEEFTYFFSQDRHTGNRAMDEIIQQAEKNEIAVNFFSEILLEPFKADLQITKGASKASNAAKDRGPNRHGIIHGSRKHLDYGSKLNGYKAFSFLSFIVYCVKDEFKKHNNQ
jgi:hypothetical protein